MNHSYEGTYHNVYLRPLAEEDIELLRTWRNNPDNTVFLRKIPYISSVMQKKWYDNYLQDPDEICFAIIETDKLMRTVGSLRLYHIREKDCEFGKILIGDPDAHGRKVGENATIAAVAIAFKELKKEQVQLQVFEENFKAIRIYEKAGFIVAECHLDVNGMKEKTMIIRKEDWKYA